MKQDLLKLGILFVIMLAIAGFAYVSPASNLNGYGIYTIQNYSLVSIANFSLSNPPAACPGGSFMTFFNGSDSLCVLGNSTGVSIDSLNDSAGLAYLKADFSQTIVGNLDMNQYNVTNIQKLNNVYYVIPNNGSDIQVKINMCSTDGCTVYVPNGEYLTDTEIILKNNLNLIGEEAEKTVIRSSTSSTSPVLNSNGADNILIENLKLIHTNVSADTHALRLFGSAGATSDNVIVRNNIIINGSHHNINSAGDNNTISDNYIYNNGNIDLYDGTCLIVKGRNNIVRNNICHDFDFSGIEVYNPSNNTLVNGNIIYWSGTSGNLGAISVTDNSYYNIVSNNNIIGNLDNKGGQAIKISGARYTLIDGNIIRDINISNGYNIWNSGGENNIISNNIIQGGYAGIHNEGDSTLISNNKFYNNRDESIYLRSSARNNLVSNNFIMNGSANTIRIAHQGNSSIIGNQILQSNGNSILVENADNVLISNNYITGSSGYGMRLQNTNYTLVTNNWLCGNTNGPYQDAGIETGSSVTNNMLCT